MGWGSFAPRLPSGVQLPAFRRPAAVGTTPPACCRRHAAQMDAGLPSVALNPGAKSPMAGLDGFLSPPPPLDVMDKGVYSFVFDPLGDRHSSMFHWVLFSTVQTVHFSGPRSFFITVPLFLLLARSSPLPLFVFLPLFSFSLLLLFFLQVVF